MLLPKKKKRDCFFQEKQKAESKNAKTQKAKIGGNWLEKGGKKRRESKRQKAINGKQRKNRKEKRIGCG